MAVAAALRAAFGSRRRRHSVRFGERFRCACFLAPRALETSARDAPVTASIVAIHQAWKAAQLAGLPDAPTSTEEPIFNGLNNELQDASPAQYGASFVRKFPLLYNQRMRDSFSHNPLAWRRIGGSHSRGATKPSLLTKGRVGDARANGAYTNHTDGGFRHQLRELIGDKRLKQVSAQRVEELSQSCL
ncbi:hypothetical protein FGB62_308g010 [Gracilaria domingensis]|nr:hypothetical protein FGB62_308g010 [Gracilaria domingensis]